MPGGSNITLSTYLTLLSDALSAENGGNLAYLLRPTSPHGKDLVKEFKGLGNSNSSGGTGNVPPALEYYRGSIASPWDEIAIQYVLTCSYVARTRSVEAFREHVTLVNKFLPFFADNRGWTLPALFSVLRDLRDLAFDADLAKQTNQRQYQQTLIQTSAQNEHENMEEAARIIARAFTFCIMDRTSPPEQSRKWGVYYVVGLVLKCYFKIKRISLSKNILRALEANKDIPDLSLYPRSHQVTFRYYLGMLHFLNEEYAKAEQELTLAFYNCHVEARANQERILTYLLPLRLLKGFLPSSSLLSRFPATRELFSPFIDAIRKGDIKGFDRELESAESRLVGLGLLLIVEKAREVCLRGVFRRVYITLSPSTRTRVPLSLFHSGLKVSGAEVDIEETECLVANMIYKGFIRGYLSHEKQMVVLASTNAFPRVMDRVEWAGLL